MVLPDVKVNAALPAFRTTAVEFVAPRAGEYRFACGMNMVSGVHRVTGTAPPQPTTAAGGQATPPPETNAGSSTGGPAADSEAADRPRSMT